MNKSTPKYFNIRVYGIIINSRKQVLLSDEFVLNTYMTKFPGGGLHFGEGPEECIKREALEEFGQEVEIISHFYTTGFFQKALFYPDHQLISIYYKLRFIKKPLFRISKIAFDFDEIKEGSQSFRWVSIDKLIEADLTFPVDRYVLNLLKKQIRQT
jgi:8-oxo-dGTP diphosphatase